MRKANPARSRSQEIERLWGRFLQSRNLRLRNQLAVRYLPLVREIAERLSARLPSSIDREDLMSAGVFGLLDAIENFDPGKGIDFEAYCNIRIRGAVLDGLRQLDWMPRPVRESQVRFHQSRNRLRMELGREPSEWEVSQDAGIPLGEVAHGAAGRPWRGPVSLDRRLAAASRSEKQHLDFLEDKRSRKPVDAVNLDDLMHVVERHLKGAERKILLDSFVHDRPMKEIARDLGLSASRICQLRTKTVERLQRLLRQHAGEM